MSADKPRIGLFITVDEIYSTAFDLMDIDKVVKDDIQKLIGGLSSQNEVFFKKIARNESDGEEMGKYFSSLDLDLIIISEFVYTLSAIDFNVEVFVSEAGGYLRGVHEYMGTHGETYGGAIVKQVALDNSVNPRLLLALLEYQSGWVYGQPKNKAAQEYPLGEIDLSSQGLLRQLKWAVNQLSIGYYGWREGRLQDSQGREGRGTGHHGGRAVRDDGMKPGNQVWSQVRDRVWNRVRDRVWGRVGNRVGGRVRDRVGGILGP